MTEGAGRPAASREKGDRRRPPADDSRFLEAMRMKVEETEAPTAGPRLETLRVITETFRLATDKRLELYNLTERVAEILKKHDIKEGVVLLQSLHTTLAL